MYLLSIHFEINVCIITFEITSYSSHLPYTILKAYIKYKYLSSLKESQVSVLADSPA